MTKNKEVLMPENCSTSFSPTHDGRRTKSSIHALSKKRLLPLHFIMGLYLFWGTLGDAMAENFIDYQGIHSFYGESGWTNIGPSSQDRYEWYHLGYLAGKDLSPWLSIETTIGPGLIRTDNSRDSGSIEWRVLLNLHTKYFFLKAGPGIAYLFKSEDIPVLSNSNFFSIISGAIGFQYQLETSDKSGPAILIGYSVEHMSDPFKSGKQGDCGLNVGTIACIISWTF